MNNWFNLSAAKLFLITNQSKGVRQSDSAPIILVMFDIPSDNEPWVASQRTQQCTVTMKQWTMAPHLVYRTSTHNFTNGCTYSKKSRLSHVSSFWLDKSLFWITLQFPNLKSVLRARFSYICCIFSYEASTSGYCSRELKCNSKVVCVRVLHFS